ncbi:MAG: tRNA preQ1(34) S-adenosylmethionine ribosyltransferase-isomerase QueA [Lachnospiraceae bacterium]|nr:tRNA preQ1(34) S-adenosylmethionine ribosyltransferase-isomerase QueA [Lachnospiraceae bacterium]
MKTSDFYFDLPQELIAQDPLEDRSASRLLVLDKDTGAIEHRHFYNITEYLHPGDCLVLNNTKVIPARLYGNRVLAENSGDASQGSDHAVGDGQAVSKNNTKVDSYNSKRDQENSVDHMQTGMRHVSSDQISDHIRHSTETEKNGYQLGATIEVLLLKRKADNVWETLVRPGKKARPGTKIVFGGGLLVGEVIDVVEEGNRLIRFTYEGIFEEILDQLGQMPLPPYIKHELKDKNRYQTVYAKYEGSAATPTAGLHFTPELLDQVRAMGVRIAEVTLHVGLGTFRPVKVEDVTQHHMHSEFYQITEEAADIIRETKANGGRVICVGTTSCRTIESAAQRFDGNIQACSGWTDIFIYPGYQFRLLDALITNFHLPESTLLMLVSALAGRENILNAYRVAVEERYRFFSFGDAMFITTMTP